MKHVVGIINYGVAGNIRSINKALTKAGAETIIIETAAQLTSVDKLVLPGVGSFPDAIEELKNSGLLIPLSTAMADIPTLGICLGMQILSKVGFEFEMTNGLGFFDAEVKKIKCMGAIPHMGFNKISVQRDNPLLRGLDDQSFYFMHSYEVVNYKNILSLSNYCGHEFVSAIGSNNIFGVQFHPEKSRDAGIELFRNFLAI